MKLNSIMNRYPKTVLPSDTLIHARELMQWGGFRHLPVLDNTNHKLVGILTEGDIARHQARTGESIWSSPDDSVDMAMTHSVHTAGPDDSLTEATARMVFEKIGCLPVTEFGKLVGLATTTDVLTAEVRADMETHAQTGPSVGEVMTRDPQTVHSDDQLLNAAARMVQYRVRHLPVVDGDGHIVGMLSDRDVRASLGDPAQAFTDDTSIPGKLLRVHDAMSKPVAVATEDQSCGDAARALVDRHAGAVPVTDSNDVLVGIISYVDLLRAFADRAI